MRFPDWPERLAELVAQRRNMPFEWGKHDCCLFAADAILAMTGFDPAAPYRGKYATKLGAARLIKKVGGMEAFARDLEKIPVLMAGRGDVVLIATPEGEAFGVCIGRHAAAASPDGLAFVPMTEAFFAWRGEPCRQ